MAGSAIFSRGGQLAASTLRFRVRGDRLGQAGALRDLGYVRRVMGDYPAGAQTLEKALGIYHDLGDPGGHATQAEVLLRQALEIFRRIGAVEAAEMPAELGALTEQPA